MSPALPTSCTPRAADVLHQASSTARRAQPVDKATSHINPPSLHLIIGVCCSNYRGHFYGNVRRAIDIHEGEQIDADAFKALIAAAVTINVSSGKAKRAK